MVIYLYAAFVIKMVHCRISVYVHLVVVLFVFCDGKFLAPFQGHFCTGDIRTVFRRYHVNMSHEMYIEFLYKGLHLSTSLHVIIQ